jgi:hypothetical protein
LASRLWIIVRDHSGLIYTPVKVVRSWASCKLLVKHLWVLSEREARRVIHSAQLEWPQVIEQ